MKPRMMTTRFGERCAMRLLSRLCQSQRRQSSAAAWRRAAGCALLFSLAFAGVARALPVPLPTINTNLIYDVTNTAFAGGALGNGVSNSTAAIQAAINFASTASTSGATVRIPAVGVNTNYICGPITMKSHVNLQVATNAMLQMFPMSTWSPSYGTASFIGGATLTDIEVSGPGTIDGQGTNWWYPLASSRPNFIQFDHCTRVLIQNVRLQNPPTFTIYLKNSDTSVTIDHITIDTPYDSHNTDAFDISSTNLVIQNSFISTGDDDVEIGGSGAAATDITISNCTFGTGHGVSMGSKIGGGVNNVIVSNCWWNNTEYGIKIKSDQGDGGLVQNIKYCDMTMTNVNFPIAFYMDYTILGSPSKSISITPANAASDSASATNSSTPFYRNITISNLTAVGNSGIQGPGNIAGIMYGLPSSPVSNVTLCKVNIQGRTSDGTFCLYHVRGIQFIDCNLTTPTSGTNTLTFYNAQFTITNSAPSATSNTVTMWGLWSPSNTVVSLFNGLAETGDSGALGANPLLTLADSTLTISNNASFGTSSKWNYGLGTTPTMTAVSGNLTLGGTLNVSDGGGFTSGTYTVFTYGGTLGGTLTVGTTPNLGFTYAVSTNTHGQVNLVVSSPCSVGAAGSISGSSSVSAGASSVTYSISSVSGATTYAWTVPTGATIASGQGTTSITVNYACSASSGNVTVTPSNGTCNGGASILGVTVTGVGAAGSISGSSSVSAGASSVTYSISSVSGATTYTWTVPTGATIASGQGTTSISVNYACSASSGNVQVTPSNANGCTGTPASLGVTVTGVGAAGSISGPNLVRAGTNGVTYSISSVSGATTYAWTVPTGATIASGQGTTSITVNYACSASSGNVQVTPSNANGCTGTPASLGVTVTGVGGAGSISGSTTVCAGQTGLVYSISSVSGATVYTWTAPTGATITDGQGTTSIAVTMGSLGGNVQVTPANAYGCSGTASSLPVTVNAVPSISSDPSPQTACVGGTADFTVSATGVGLSYQWQENGSNISDGGTISGSGTITLTLTGVDVGDSGASFDCVVSGTCSPPAVSGAATLTVGAGGGPATFNVTGGGAYCAGGGGVSVGLDGSESSVVYQLELGGSPTGAPLAGTGSAISFTNVTGAGVYTVIASNATSGCTATMNGSATVSLTDRFACWQMQYFTCTDCVQAAATADPDGDGQNNMAEFLSGTNPTNGASALAVVSVVKTGADVNVTWRTAGGHTNIVQVTNGDAAGGYGTNNFQDIPASQTILPGSGDTSTNYIDLGGATNAPSRYYRVRLVP